MKVGSFCGMLAGIICIIFAVIHHDMQMSPLMDQPQKIRFQQLIGGLGLGAVLVPAWNFCDYDPRLQSDPGDILYPIPAGYPYSPDRLAMVSNFTEQGIRW